MRTLKNFMAATAATLMSTAALAADLPPPPMYVPPPVEDFGGWYLRGDIGFSNQQVKRLETSADYQQITSSRQSDFSTAGIYGLGAGYQFNNWFRADVTGEYRGNSSFHGTDRNTFSNGLGGIGVGLNNYTATKSEILVLANAYFDLGTWWCVTPFVGAGIGTARVTIAGFTDQGIINLDDGNGSMPSAGLANTASKWNLAWAAHAGLAYKVSPSLTMELAYRYVNMGSGATGDLLAYDGTPQNIGPMRFKDITSHDLKVGLRWAIDPTPSYAPPMLPPLIRKG